jgi:hypothetical protein
MLNVAMLNVVAPGKRFIVIEIDCKLDRFIIKKLYFFVLKRYSLLKRLSKFTPKKYLRIVSGIYPNEVIGDQLGLSLTLYDVQCDQNGLNFSILLLFT